MSFSLTFLNCSEAYRSEIERFIENWKTGLTEFEVKTSGSTGEPKTIVLKRNQLIASAKRTVDYFKLAKNSNSVCVLPFQSIAGKMQVVRALVGEFHLIILEAQKNPFPLLLAESISFFPLSALQLNELIDLNLYDSFQKTTFLLGGSIVSEELIQKIEKTGLNVYQGYGMTETVSHIALKKVHDENYELLDGVSIKSSEKETLINDSHLEISNLSVTDILAFSNAKQFKFIGRRDNIINSGGVKISPEPIEILIFEILGLEIILIALPDTILGEKCVCLCEKKLSISEINSIEQLIKSNFSNYAVPKHYLQHSIEKGNYGKILRKKIQLDLQKEIDLNDISGEL